MNLQKLDRGTREEGLENPRDNHLLQSPLRPPLSDFDQPFLFTALLTSAHQLRALRLARQVRARQRRAWQLA